MQELSTLAALTTSKLPRQNARTLSTMSHLWMLAQMQSLLWKKQVDHPYYAQVQGQMAVTGARWCDFIVYTSRGLYVQRITFDPIVWAELNQKLVSYYFIHFIKFASAELCQGNCQVNNSNDCQVICTSTTV